jgi:uncharacterized membrane protein YdjX (TVP38/TMEM64 family)
MPLESQPQQAPSTAPDAAASTQSQTSPADMLAQSDWSSALRRLGPIAPMAIVAVTLPLIGGFLLLATMESFVGPWLRAQGAWGIWIYVIGFAVTSGLALLPTYAQAILGGWAFRFDVGFPAALAGFAGGAVIGYFVARALSGNRLQTIVSEQPRWKAVYEALLGSGAARTLLLVTLLRVPPNSPFAVTNLVLAAARVPLWIYIVGTVVGMAPRTAAVVYFAAQATELSFSRSTGWLEYGIGIALTLAVLVIIGRIAQQALQRVVADTNSPA